MQMIKALLNGEFEIIIHEHRAARPEWTSEKGWEKARLRSLHEQLGPGDTIYYVGAERGEMPALCEMWGARTVLFEPNSKAWPVIRAVYEANGLKPLKCFAGFASDVTAATTSKIHEGWQLRDDGWPGHTENEITPEHGFNQLYQEAASLPQVTIDDYVAESGIIPTAIVMDVEGAEGRVLRGAEKTIMTHKPKLWLSVHPEFLITQYNEWSYLVRSWVTDRGYTEEFLDYQHELHVFYQPK